MIRNEGVRPIWCKEELEKFKEQIRRNGKFGKRNYIMILIPLNTGLRIGDVVKLKVKDVYEKDLLKIKPEKSHKTLNKKLVLPLTSVKKEIKEYVDEMDLEMNDYLIKSRQRDSDGIVRGISSTQAYRIIKEAANDLNMNNIATHSMRKSFAYHYYQSTKDIAGLMEMLGHKQESETLRYIGLRSEDIKNKMWNFKL